MINGMTPEETMRRIATLLGQGQLQKDTNLSAKTISTWLVDRTAGGKTSQTPSRGPLRLLLRWSRLCIRCGRPDIVLGIVYQFMAILFPNPETEEMT